MSDSCSSTTVTFKKRSRPSGLSAKRKLDEDQDDSKDEEDKVQLEDGQTIEEIREMQRLKKLLTQTRGVNVASLIESSSKKNQSSTTRKEISGLTDANALKSELDLGNTFSVETNKRDEDAEMAKFIEQELARRKGLLQQDSSSTSTVPSSVEDLVYNELPQHLLTATGSKKNEEMLSNQMLSGIPEVDLGVDEKIRNIDATEEAKKKLLQAKMKSLQSGERGRNQDDLIPSNVAVNFNQVTRTKAQDLKAKSQQAAKTSVAVVEEPVVVLGHEPRPVTFTEQTQSERQLKHPGHMKASDDYHFEKFRKQFRKK